MAVDGSDADSLACDAGGIINDVTGKIAVIYRGDCEFGAKALAVQNAGAIACVIINHTGPPIPMGGGADGLSVTIPTFMIGEVSGAFLRSSIDAGGTQVGIFNKTGFYNNDLGITPFTVLRAEHFAHPTVLSQNSEYVVQMGADIINYGINTQTNVALSAVVSKGESVLYNEISATVFAMETGDTVSFDLPPFTLDDFGSGFYDVAYAVVYTEVDDFPNDNLIHSDFMISDSLFAYSRVNPLTGLPNNVTGTRPGGTNDDVQICVEFQDPNASKVFVEGMTFSSSMGANEPMEGITMDCYLYLWAAGEDLSDDALEELAFGSYEYLSNDLSDVNIYVPFEEGIVTLVDDVQYLFCINYFTDGLFTGFDNGNMDYNKNSIFYDKAFFPIEDNDEWFEGGFGTDRAPAITVNMKDPLYDAINEEAQRVEITPFPNPTANEINIPVGNYYGKTTIDVYDIAGKKVKSLNITTTSYEIIKVNVSDLDNGAYIFKMNFEDGSFSNFNVIVNN
jgi:hypothetical protein